MSKIYIGGPSEASMNNKGFQKSDAPELSYFENYIKNNLQGVFKAKNINRQWLSELWYITDDFKFLSNLLQVYFESNNENILKVFHE